MQRIPTTPLSSTVWFSPSRLALEIYAGAEARCDGIGAVGIDHVRDDIGVRIAMHYDAAALLVGDGSAEKQRLASSTA